MTDDSPALSSIPYDELEVGERLGPFPGTVSGELASQLAGPIGAQTPVGDTPPGVYPVLLLQGLRRALGGIPSGGILAGQRITAHRVLPAGSDVETWVWIGAKEIKRDRRFVTVEFDIREEGGDSVLTASKTIIWPAGDEG
jgi:hypothetical protein